MQSERIIIDEDDFVMLKNKNYTFGISGDYARCYGEDLGDKGEYIHRILLGLNKGDGFTVDHINRNRKDYTRTNLRKCLIGQNVCNKASNFSWKSSGFKGVHKHQKKWRVQAWKNNKKYDAGCFEFEIEGAIAYDKLAKELHGEFAFVNFKTPEEQLQACLKLAELKTLKYKKELAPTEIFGSDIPRNGGSYGTPKPEKTSQVLQAYAQYLPGVLQATNSQATPTAQANLQAEQATEPGFQALNTQLTAQYAPLLAEINSAIQRQQSLSGASTQAATLEGPGGQAAADATALARANNPEFYKTLDASAQKSQDLLNSYNLQGLSPGEQAATERGMNQTNTATGNLGLINPTNTVQNALQFGQAFDAKRAALGGAIGVANNTANTAQNTGFNPVSVALSQPGATGLTQFQNSGTGSTGASGALNFGSGLLGNQFGSNNAMIGAAASRANANSVPSFMGAMPSYS